MRKYQKETKSSKQKRKPSKNIHKETIDVMHLVNRTGKKKKKRANSSHPLKKSVLSNKIKYNENNKCEGSMRSFGSQVVPVSKLKQSLIRTGLKNSGFFSQAQDENYYGI
jgi:hypothetical protein